MEHQGEVTRVLGKGSAQRHRTGSPWLWSWHRADGVEEAFGQYSEIKLDFCGIQHGASCCTQ